MEEAILELSKRTSDLGTEENNVYTLKKGQLIELFIADMAYGGKGIAKIETEKGIYIIFVPNAIPGQKVQCRVTKRNRKYAEARLIRVLQPSSLEIEIPFQAASGAPYASLDLATQHFYKKRNTLEQFKRIALVSNIEDYLDEFVASPVLWHYRNKMEFNFSGIVWNIGDEKSHNGFGFGFKKRACWWASENLEKSSGLFDEQFENAMSRIRKYLEETGLPAYHHIRNEGFYRILQVKKSYFEDKLLMNLNTTSEGLDQFSLPAFYDFINDLFPNRVKGLIHSINDEVSDRFNGPEGQKSILGDPFIVEKINGLEFQINSYSFFQTNPKSAEVLYNKVIDYVFEEEVKGQVLDLFCGTGTIAQLIAKREQNQLVTGVELVPEAVEDAKINAQKNELKNVKFIAADVGQFLKDHPEYQNQIDVLVLDPPRGGISKKALRAAMRLNARKVVYVSCNPSTQARDANWMNDFDYQLKKLSIVDQFPHTSHIETIAVFEKN
ncbi:MAG: 23S rRNA (uracil(1939)-C(5))-methyltransferase RlmD [Bacteroidota bacterium]